MRSCFLFIAALTTFFILSPTYGEDVQAENPIRIAVIVPERIDVEWFWYYYTTESQHLVQSAIEKALLNKGFDLVDLTSAASGGPMVSLDQIINQASSKQLATDLGATHLVTGSAIASQAGQSHAYGVGIHRYTADIALRVVQLSDGAILATAEASETLGAEARRAAARKSLKEAGGKAARSIATKLQHALDPVTAE